MATVTYYFNSWSSNDGWTNPNQMVDNSLVTYAKNGADFEELLLDANTCPGTNLGTITKVEMRCYGGIDTGFVYGKPVFTGGDGTPAILNNVPHFVGPVWDSYVNITSDTNAPNPWTWNDVVALDIKVFPWGCFSGGDFVYSYKVEIQITYTPPTKNYTRESNASLPTTSADLSLAFTSAEETLVATDDSDYVSMTGAGVYNIGLFKNVYPLTKTGANFQVTWNGNTGQDPSVSTVFLQLYNWDTNTWDTFDQNNAASTGADFTLTGAAAGVDVYKYTSGSDWVSWRVYQEAI